MPSDNPKVKSIARLILDTFANEGYARTVRDDNEETCLDYVEIDGTFDLEELAEAIIKEVVGPTLIVNAQADALDEVAVDIGWFGAQGNLIHPDTASAGITACRTAIKEKAATLRKGE